MATKRYNIRFYAHGQLCLEQAKVAIALGASLKEWMESKCYVNFHGFGWAMQGLTVESMTFPTTLISLLLYIILNYLSFALGFESIGLQISAL
jgi:hypothetical protein